MAVALAGYDYAGPQPSDLARDLAGAVQSTITDEFRRAKDYIEQDIGPLRTQATQYYKGDPRGDEEDGRSQFMSRDVRDTTMNYLPSIMRTLFGPDRVVEFVPNSPAKAALAEQATDFVNLVVLRQDNDGFAECYSAVKDALIRKLGFVKWWWEDAPRKTGAKYTGLDETALHLLAKDHDTDSMDIRIVKAPDGSASYSATVRRTDTTGRIRFMSVPPEELLVNREARSIRTARCIFHRQVLLVNDVVRMGYDVEEALAGADATTDLEDNEEAAARRYGETASGGNTGDPMLRKVLYVEGYLLLPEDPDEADTPYSLHKVCCVGSDAMVLTLDGEPAIEPCPGFPFAAFAVDPEPHVLFGSCPADMAMDVQDVKTSVQRGLLDSLALAIEPRTEVVEGMVNLHDLMNPEVNRIVRVRQPGMMREVNGEFLGAACLPVLGYYDQVLQQRTKMNDASQGLAPDALQSTTKAGVEGTLGAAQAQQELTARLIAEGGLRDLFRGILRLLCQHQQQARTVRLREDWVAVDPREWDAEMDVAVNVGLGNGGRDEKIASLMAIKQAQEQIFTLLGNKNDLVTPHQYRTTLARMAEMGGWHDANAFFQPIPREYEAPENPPAADPTEVLARVQMAELQMKAEISAAELRHKHMEVEMENATKRFVAMLQAQTSVKQGEARAGKEFDAAQLAHDAAYAGKIVDAQTAAHVAELEAAVAMHTAESAKRSETEEPKEPEQPGQADLLGEDA